MTDNILNEVQRETSGASTFAKYDFQYHWALCQIIEKHKKNEEYALLVEYHEDVVIADNLDGQQASFEFYQVKNQTASYTPYTLTKRSPGQNGDKNSVLGKLLSSCVNKKYEHRITDIGLVSSSKFSKFKLKLNNDSNKLRVITKGDLSDCCLKEITDKIHDELGIDILPENLKFIVPTIKLENQTEYVIAQFAELVNQLFPKSRCNSVEIYQAIIDEIHRKGCIALDFSDWEELVNQKSLSSEKVSEVLAINTSHPGTERLESDFNLLAQELGWGIFQIRKYRNSLIQLSLRRTGFISSRDLNIIHEFSTSLNKVDLNSSTTEYFDAIQNQVKIDKLDNLITDPQERLIEVFYYLLVSNDESKL